jgi:hypothetical protein
MATSYTRQSSFSDGDTITAALFNDEFNQLLTAFSYASSSTTGHRHDGTAAEGGNVHTIGDQDFLNKIVADDSNNRWGVFVEVSSAAVEQVRFQDGVIVPVTDNDIDLGTSSVEFKDAYFDGTVTTDALTVDVNATVGGTLGVTGALTGSSTVQGTTITATTAFVPDASDGAALGTSSLEFSDLFLADGAVINFGDDQDITLTHAADTGLTTNGTFQATTITATTAFVPDASDGAALGTSALEFSDLFLADGAVINFGDDQDVSLTHVADTGLLISSTDQLQFGDSGTYIFQSADGVLDLVSDSEIEINATTIDINGAVAMDGAMTGGTDITISGELDAATLDISGNADIDGTLEADAYTVDGTALNEYIADTVGAMVGSNTETNITVTYEDSDNTLDFVIGTLNQNTTGTADNFTASENNSTDETVYPVFVDGATGSQGAETDTGLTYNPSTGVLTATQFTGAVSGTASTATVATTVTITDNESTNETNAIIFTAGGDVDGGNLGLESDGDLTYNPSTGLLSSTGVTASGTVTFGTLSDGTIGVTAWVDEDDMSTDSATLVPTQQSVKAYVDSQTSGSGSMSSFILEDDDGTEVSISDAEEVKFIGSGITTNWTDTTPGSDADPFDMTFTVDAAQTGITSIYATDLIMGEDSQTAIDFGTENEIDFKVDNAARLTLTSSALYPVTDNEIDLGTASLEFKDAFFDGTVTADAFAGPLTGNVTGNASGTALTVTQAAQSAITSLGTLTALTVDNITVNGNTITADSGALNLTPASGSAIVLDGTINVDAGVVTGATSITSTAFVGDITGDVTGDVSGTAATVTTAAQSSITSLGTLTTLTVDNVRINGTTIGHTSDTNLMTLGSSILTVAGEVSMTTLDIGGTNVTSTAAELNILDGVTSTAAELNLVDGADTLKEVGKETIYVPAAAMYPETTNGCAALAQVELSNGPELKCLDFATGADDFAQFTVAFPKSWNEGTVTFQAFWTVTGTNGGTVAWALAGGSMANDASINTAFGTVVTATALAHSGTSNDMMVSAASGAVTIANAAADTLTYFQVSRDVSADDQTGDARLLGIKLFFTTDAANDA